jgi:hypothetical protein
MSVSIRDLLKNAYSNLQTRNPHQEIALENEAFSVIADDSDWHRSRTGYMKYNKADVFDFGKSWALGIGEKAGSYPARPYDSDIIALELSQCEPMQIQKEIGEKIAASSYFENSLVFGYADGNLGINKEGRFGNRMMQLIKPKVPEFIAQRPEYDESVIELSTLRPPVTREMTYKPKFADFITEVIETVLREESKK